MRVWLVCVCISFCVQSNAQNFHSFFRLDTLKFTDRIGGELDSIDLIGGVQSSSFPGGGLNTRENTFTPDLLVNNPGGQRFYSFGAWKKMQFTGLPHIGFSYSFGSQGTQYVQTEYQQAFKDSIYLNVDYIKYRSNGFLRNSDFSHNDFQLQLNRLGRIYSLELKGSYETSDVAQCNGLTTDSLANDFPLIFLPVQKTDARLKTKRIRVYQSNYFDFLKDSLNSIGLFTQHELRIKKFEYSEFSDTLYNLYSVINFDSLQTNDQHQWSQIASGAGLFLKNKNHFLKTGVNVEFWNFQNLGLYRDTTEVDLFGEYNYSRNKTSLVNKLDVNLIGAQNEFSNDLQLIQGFDRIYFKAHFLIENKLPDYYQRYSIGNNYSNVFNSQNKQQRVLSSLTASSYIGNFELKGSYTYSSYRNNYFFIDSTWRNDTMTSMAFNQFTLNLSYRYKALFLESAYSYTISNDEFGIIPQHIFQSRIYVKRGVFKARKMIAYTGFDFSALSAFRRVGFQSNIGAFDLTTIKPSTAGYMNLHFFGGFQIEEFKFFLRVENLNHFWIDRKTEVLQSFPIASTQFRLGITWDFFN